MSKRARRSSSAAASTRTSTSDRRGGSAQSVSTTSLRFSRRGDKTTQLDEARLAGDASFARRQLGRGQILFFSLPLELSDDVALVGRVYAWALQQAKVAPLYRTTLDDPGILICPFPLETGTLYAFTSESASPREVTLRDAASGAEVRVSLDPGRAALALVTRDGRIVARYSPQPAPAAAESR